LGHKNQAETFMKICFKLTTMSEQTIPCAFKSFSCASQETWLLPSPKKCKQREDINPSRNPSCQNWYWWTQAYLKSHILKVTLFWKNTLNIASFFYFLPVKEMVTILQW